MTRHSEPLCVSFKLVEKTTVKNIQISRRMYLDETTSDLQGHGTFV